MSHFDDANLKKSYIKKPNKSKERIQIVYTSVNYTFIVKKSFKYLKNFNETAADTAGSIYFQIMTAPFLKYIILYLLKRLLFHRAVQTPKVS